MKQGKFKYRLTTVRDEIKHIICIIKAERSICKQKTVFKLSNFHPTRFLDFESKNAQSIDFW